MRLAYGMLSLMSPFVLVESLEFVGFWQKLVEFVKWISPYPRL